MLKQSLASFILLTFLVQGMGQLISNGGFENGINPSWSHKKGDGSAKFFEDHSHVKEGANSLRVKVSQLPSSGHIRSINNSFSNTGEGTYLLRFWAIADEDHDLYVSVEGSENDLVHFELKAKWHLYHLPFDTESGELSLRFIYPDLGYYVIDGVEILDQNSGIIDVEQTFKWNEGFADEWGWVAGDNDISLELPDSRIIYFFNDSFYGYNDPTDNRFHNEVTRFLRNAMVVEEQDGLLYSHYSGTQNNTTRYFESIDPSPQPGVDNFYWVGDAVMHDDHILVYLVELLNSPGGATATDRTYIASLSYPQLDLEGIFPQEEFANSYEAFFAEGAYYYLYRTQPQGIWNSTTHVARCDQNDLLGSSGTWQFYNGSEWADDPAASAPINNERAEAFTRLQEGNYVQISMPVLSNQVKASFAPSPIGPWTPSQVIYTIPSDEEYWWYLPNLHHQLPNGKFQISYSVNSWEGWADAWKDKYWYRQRYIQVDLLGLSPYTEIARDNLALDRPVVASTDQPLAHLTVDGDSQSSWSNSENNVEWIYVDLGSMYDISQLKLIWAEDSPKRFQIGYSTDSQHWNIYKTIKDNESMLNDLCALRMIGRYVSIRIQNAPNGFDLSEIEVYGVPLDFASTDSKAAPSDVRSHPFPIPFDDFLSVPLSSFGQEQVDILLYDLKGQEYFLLRTTAQDKAFQRVDLGTIGHHPLPAGIYFIEVIGESKRELHRVIKE